MNRSTDVKNMDAPAVGSGKEASETMLNVKSASQTSSEKGTNELREYVAEASPKGKLGGCAQ